MNSSGSSLGTPLLLCREVGVQGLSCSWVLSVLGSWDQQGCWLLSVCPTPGSRGG